MTEPLLLTVKETAALLNIGKNQAYELIAQGVIPSMNFGRSIRVPRNRLVAWVEENSNGGGLDNA